MASTSSSAASTSSSAGDKRSPSPATSPQPQSSPRNPLDPDDFDLEDRVAKLLGTEDLVPLLESIIEYAENKEEKYLRIFKSLVCLYPECFCLKLNEILKFNPSFQIRSEIFHLLRYALRESVPVSSSVLFKLKQTILNSLIMETEDFLFPCLCELIGQVADGLYRRYPIGSWDELLQYFISMISSFSESNRNKGILLLTEFPILVARNKKFWLNQGGFDIAYTSVMQSFNTKGRKSEALAYNASISLMLLSKDLQRTDVSETLLPILLNIFSQHREDEGLVTKLKRLMNLVTMDDGNIFRVKQRQVFWSMIRVAEIEGASDELQNEAVKIIKELEMKNVYGMEAVIKKFSSEEMRRVVAVSFNMMACFVDDPLWFDVYSDDCKSAGFTENFNHGQFLFKCLCFYAHDSVFIPTAVDMLAEKYASHVRWRFRNSAMFAVGSMAEYDFIGIGMIRYFEKVAILVLNSLDELNHRVLWATMHAINILSECKELLIHTEYDKKFLEKLVPIAKRHCCARVQSYAVITIRQLEDTCGLKRTSLSDTDTGAHTIAALQDSNVAGHRNVLTRTLDELEGEVNAASKFLTQRSLLTAKDVNNIVFGPRPAAEP